MTITLIGKLNEKPFVRALPDVAEVYIGRDRTDSRIVRGLLIAEEHVSRVHCVLCHQDNFYSVRDLNSRNGTYVNDYKILEETPIRDGDELNIGGEVRFKVEIE